jgi:hypothetical protein
MLAHEAGGLVHDGPDIWRWQNDADCFRLRGQLLNGCEVKPRCAHIAGWHKRAAGERRRVRDHHNSLRVHCSAAICAWRLLLRLRHVTLQNGVHRCGWLCAHCCCCFTSGFTLSFILKP